MRAFPLASRGAHLRLFVQDVDGQSVHDYHDEERDEEGQDGAVDHKVVISQDTVPVVENVGRVNKT